jgi:predicted membrane protein
MNAESTLLNLKSRKNKLSNQLFPIIILLCLHFFLFLSNLSMKSLSFSIAYGIILFYLVPSLSPKTILTRAVAIISLELWYIYQKKTTSHFATHLSLLNLNGHMDITENMKVGKQHDKPSNCCFCL